MDERKQLEAEWADIKSHKQREDGDHDLLVEINVKLELLYKTFSSLKSDHEMRIRRLELWGAIAIGLGYAAQFYFNFLNR